MTPHDILPESFFARDAVEVAHDLIGRWIHLAPITLRITEVEAYREDDTACHAHRGKTERNAPLFGPPGRVYLYICYGIHRMLNFVTGTDGHAQGVLIRACSPVAGLDLITERRGGKTGPVSLTGPGKIGAALALDKDWRGHPLFEAGGLEVQWGEPAIERLVGPRVGIDYAEPKDRDAPWRIAEAGTRWVSVRKTLTTQ